MFCGVCVLIQVDGSMIPVKFGTLEGALVKKPITVEVYKFIPVFKGYLFIRKVEGFNFSTDHTRVFRFRVVQESRRGITSPLLIQKRENRSVSQYG